MTPILQKPYFFEMESLSEKKFIRISTKKIIISYDRTKNDNIMDFLQK